MIDIVTGPNILPISLLSWATPRENRGSSGISPYSTCRGARGAYHRGALLKSPFRVQPARRRCWLGTFGAQPAAVRDGEDSDGWG